MAETYQRWCVLLSYGDGEDWILGKQDTLELNDEEIDQLLDVVKRALECLLRNLVVPSRAKRGCNTAS